VRELLKLASAIPPWHGTKMVQFLAIGLLYKKIISFEQVVVLVLLAIIIESIGPKADAPNNGSRPRTGDGRKRTRQSAPLSADGKTRDRRKTREQRDVFLAGQNT
jgi:hypothetical protein